MNFGQHIKTYKYKSRHTLAIAHKIVFKHYNNNNNNNENFTKMDPKNSSKIITFCMRTLKIIHFEMIFVCQREVVCFNFELLEKQFSEFLDLERKESNVCVNERM